MYPLPVSHHLDRRAAKLVDQPGNDDDLLKTPEAAEWLGVSEQWLEGGRHHGYGPDYLKVGPRMVRYRRGTIRKWLRGRVKRTQGVAA
jgi:predicted DNA-binding transcriptional regulator AlpA